MKKYWINSLCLVSAAVLLASCSPGKTDSPPDSSSRETAVSQEETSPAAPSTEETESSWLVGKKGDLWILPDSDTHVYTRNELSTLTGEELRLARNELYARHGRIFTSPELSSYFSEKEWYKPSIQPEDFPDGLFSETEAANLATLQAMEAGPLSPPPLSADQFPRLDGSTATLPISQALCQLITGADPLKADTAVVHTKTSSAYWNLLYAQSPEDGPDLVIAYEPSPDVKEAMARQGDPLILKPIGRDALVFMANQSNPLSSLTEEQLVDIYTGALTNWSQAGGKDLAVTAFQRPAGSGSQSLMEKLVMDGRPMADAPKEYVISEMGELLESVAAYDNTGGALGYSVYYYARNMYRKPELKFMAVNGVSPSPKTIRDGSYPYVNDFYAVIRKDEPADSPARILFDWLTSDDGQALINGLGYVGERAVSRLLPDALTEEAPVPSGVLDLPEGTVLLADGEYLYGESGTAVFDSRMKEIAFIPRTSCQGLNSFMEWDLTTPLILTDLGGQEESESRTGLYSLAKMDWIVPPDYLYIASGSPGYLLTSGEFAPDSGLWTYSYSCVDRDGRVQFSGKEEAYDRYQQMKDQARPSSPEEFAARHPELLERYGASADDVRFYYPLSPYQDPLACIREDTVDHYYSLSGKFLMDFDTGGSSEEFHYYYGEDLGDGTAFLQETSLNGSRYCLYRNGSLEKTIQPDAGQQIIPGAHFYASVSGNYVDIFNYRDELCARFLLGSSRLD